MFMFTCTKNIGLLHCVKLMGKDIFCFAGLNKGALKL